MRPGKGKKKRKRRDYAWWGKTPFTIVLNSDHIVGMIVHDGITDIMQFGQQSSFTDHVSGTVLLSGSEVVGGGHGAGEDIFVVAVEPYFTQFIAYVAVGPLTIIGEEKIRPSDYRVMDGLEKIQVN